MEVMGIIQAMEDLVEDMVDTAVMEDMDQDTIVMEDMEVSGLIAGLMVLQTTGNSKCKAFLEVFSLQRESLSSLEI